MFKFLVGLIAFAYAEEKPLFRLVGVYDSSGVLGVSDGISERYLWNPDQKMLDSCGPSKSPDALGVFEAEAVANQMMPTLAVVLEHTDLPVFVDKDGKPCAQQEDDVCKTKPIPMSRPRLRPRPRPQENLHPPTTTKERRTKKKTSKAKCVSNDRSRHDD